jgi:SAM-dependent methyltransferase
MIDKDFDRLPSAESRKLLSDYVSLISEFFGVPPLQVEERLRNEFDHPGQEVANAWRAVGPTTAEEIVKFYQETDSYIFDLAADHCKPHRAHIWGIIEARIRKRSPDGRVLIYGDGIGTDSISLARLGYEVVYYDLPGMTSDFAVYRINKSGLGERIQVIRNLEEIPANAFEAVICIEVLEHLKEPVSAMRRIYDVLVEGGVAVITESFGSVGDDYPSHLPENLGLAGKTHQLMESIGFANTYYNTSPINYPMEFKKVRQNLLGHSMKYKGKLKRAIETRWRSLRAPKRLSENQI